jgi:hypothetical protein
MQFVQASCAICAVLHRPARRRRQRRVARYLLPRPREDHMSKKFDKFVEIGLDDLAMVTGGQSGSGAALEIKKKQEDEAHRGHQHGINKTPHKQ